MTDEIEVRELSEGSYSIALMVMAKSWLRRCLRREQGKVRSVSGVMSRREGHACMIAGDAVSNVHMFCSVHSVVGLFVLRLV